MRKKREELCERLGVAMRRFNKLKGRWTRKRGLLWKYEDTARLEQSGQETMWKIESLVKEVDRLGEALDGAHLWMGIEENGGEVEGVVAELERKSRWFYGVVERELDDIRAVRMRRVCRRVEVLREQADEDKENMFTREESVG